MIEPTEREMVREMLDEWLATPGQAYISAEAFRALIAGCEKLSATVREEGRQEERERCAAIAGKIEDQAELSAVGLTASEIRQAIESRTVCKTPASPPVELQNNSRAAPKT